MEQVFFPSVQRQLRGLFSSVGLVIEVVVLCLALACIMVGVTVVLTLEFSILSLSQAASISPQVGVLGRWVQ